MEVATFVEFTAWTKLQTVAELPYMELPLCSKIANSEKKIMGKLAPLLNREPTHIRIEWNLQVLFPWRQY